MLFRRQKYVGSQTRKVSRTTTTYIRRFVLNSNKSSRPWKNFPRALLLLLLLLLGSLHHVDDDGRRDAIERKPVSVTSIGQDGGCISVSIGWNSERLFVHLITGRVLRSVDDYQSPTQRWGHSLFEESRGRTYPRTLRIISASAYLQHQHHGHHFHIIWIISKAYNESRQVWLLLSSSGSWITALIQQRRRPFFVFASKNGCHKLLNFW